MNTNPYASPQSAEIEPRPEVGSRAVALRDVRASLLIVLIPAAYNLICVNYPATPPRRALAIHDVYRFVNTVGFISIVLLVWFAGLWFLELATSLAYGVFGRQTQRSDWRRELYLILHRAPAFSVIGAILWALWDVAVYHYRVPFYTIAIPIGIAAHLLAAGLYIPLLLRWYKLERSSTEP